MFLWTTRIHRATKGSRQPPLPFKLALTKENMLFYLARTDPTIEMRSRGDGVGGILPSSSALIAPIRGTLILRKNPPLSPPIGIRGMGAPSVNRENWGATLLTNVFQVLRMG